MKRSWLIIFVILFSVIFAGSVSRIMAAEKPVMQIAILLDTSSSMDGLIEQTKSQLWKIINELASAKKDGRNPRIEVALFEYGNDHIPAGEGYIRMVSPLTNDLDKISEQLFRLTTYGGNEYCGQVISAAVDGLEWSREKNVYKAIFIAGNEPFTQGMVNYNDSIKKAVKRGIVVNTIFCGEYEEGVTGKWKSGADLADGSYFNIDHNQKVAVIETPQDKEILKLNEELNRTYIPYGHEGESRKELQAKQDRNATGSSPDAAVERSVAKASKQYSNSGWDLLDAVKEDRMDIAKMKEEQLPPEIKDLKPEDRKAYIETKMKKRQEIQKKITKLNNERKEYITRQASKTARADSLDSAVSKTVRIQASKKNYKFQ